MPYRYHSRLILAAAAAMICLCAPAYGAEDVRSLYRITLSSFEEEHLLRDSDIDVIAGLDNEYLISAYAEQAGFLRNAGVQIELLVERFKRDEWVLATAMKPDLDLASLTEALGERSVFTLDYYLLIRVDEFDQLKSDFKSLMEIAPPLIEQPIQYVPDVPRQISIPESPIVDSIVGLISADSLEAYDRRLEAFTTRHVDSDSILSARDWLRKKFESFGLSVSLDSFPHSRDAAPYGYNVVADKVGTAAPEQYIIIGGHYDTVENCPGADDNGSGTSMTLEIARVFSGFDLPKSVRFICFSDEEVGLVGSAAYVDGHLDQNIEVMINGDMIANNHDPEHPWYNAFNIFNNLASRPFAELISNEATTYTDLFGDAGVGNSSRSDHVDFQKHWPAVFVHEGIFSPNYHDPTDLADALDFEYAAGITKAAAAAAYRVAVSPPAVPEIAVADIGKADRLLVKWEMPVDSRDFNYVISLGTTQDHMVEIYTLEKDASQFIVPNLEEGIRYYVGLTTRIGDTLDNLSTAYGSAVPNDTPLTPGEFEIEPSYRSVSLVWSTTSHTDIVMYRIYRSVASGDDFRVIREIDDTSWVDQTVNRMTEYEYYLVAVDDDSNVSAPTSILSSRGLFNDNNLLVALEDGENHNVDTVMSFPRLRAMLSDIPHDEVVIATGSVGNQNDFLRRELLGQYRAVYWISDGLSFLAQFDAEMEWYLGYGGHLFVAGPTLDDDAAGVFSWIAGSARSSVNDFVGATGLTDWPDADLDTTVESGWNYYQGNSGLFYVPVIDYDSNVAEAVYLYQSSTQDTATNGKACGAIATVDGSKQAYVTFPLAHLEVEAGRRILNHVADVFGITRSGAGDFNGDSLYTLVDAVAMVRALFSTAPLPVDINRYDVNGDCKFDILDAVHLFRYIYLGESPPRYGCVDK